MSSVTPWKILGFPSSSRSSRIASVLHRERLAGGLGTDRRGDDPLRSSGDGYDALSLAHPEDQSHDPSEDRADR
jgi:hypothetical protein